MNHLNLNKRKHQITEKDIFKNIVETLDYCGNRELELADNYGIDVSSFIEPYLAVIENFLLLLYGENKTEIIIWWVYARFDEEGKLLPIEFEDEDQNTEDVYLKTIDELWEFLKKLDINE